MFAGYRFVGGIVYVIVSRKVLLESSFLTLICAPVTRIE